MSCNCQTPAAPSGEPLPLVSDDCPVAITTSLSSCCTDPEALPSAPSEGATLPAWATDAACYESGVVMLGRVGSKLARLVGTGFLAITSGTLSVVTSVPLQVRNLWHRWWKATATSNPVLGAPLDFPYHVIADSNGNIYAIKGGEVDGVHMWDVSANAWVLVPTAEIPHCVTGVIPRAANIELVGYVPLGENDPVTDIRCQKALSGAGIVVLTEVATAASDCGCGPIQPGDASIAAVFELPTIGTHALKCIDGILTWVDETPT